MSDPAADPFDLLGLPPDARPEEIRRARRELAKRAHPDVGGDAATMRAINDAAATALRRISERERADATTGSPGEPAPHRPGSDERSSSPTSPGQHDTKGWDRRRHDAPSFTVEALPVETFEALVLAASALGEVADDDPPYSLDVLLGPPLHCWCHLAIVPDAGASTVSLSVASAAGAPATPIERVRDAFIAELNALDWNDLA